MRIEFETTGATREEMGALIALLGILRGDEMGPMPAAPEAPPIAAAPPAPDAPPPPAPPALIASESLIEAHAASIRAAQGEAGTDVDQTGLPYDARIHSGTKVKNNDGSWRNKRNVNPGLLATVTAELRAAIGAEPGDSTPDTAFTPPAAAVPPAPDVPPPPTPDAPPAPTAPAAPEGLSYPAVIKIASDKGKTYDELNELAATFGLTAFKDLKDRPDLFELFVGALG